jgi:DNA-binding IclR family transcriptional regulator
MSRTLKRIVDIIDCFDTGHASLSLTEISECAELDLATASRFLNALEQERLVRRDPVTKRYVLGSRLIEWGARALDDASIRTIAEPIMAQLHRATNETVALYIRDGDQRICVATYESPEPVRHVLPLGSKLRITQAAGGRAMLAGLPEQEALQLLRTDPLLTDVERAEIERELPDIRKRGYALGVHLMTPHAWSMASPIFDRSGAVSSVLVVSGPDARIDDRIAERHAELLVPAARELSRALGALPLSTDVETNGRRAYAMTTASSARPEQR